MRFELQSIKVKDYIDVTDYVANGSFAALKANVTYSDTPDFAVLVRLTDHNSGWKNDLVYVDESSYKFLKKSSVQPGDVIISNVGANAGTVFRAPDLGLPMTLGPNSVLLKPKINTPEAKDFLYYFFSSPKGQHNLSSILSGSAQPKFNKTDLRNTEIPVPKGIELSEVTDLLKSLDEKISLNLETNKTLEQMAQTIFKSWFVDFDPVKAKMNGEQPEGMDAVTASLFPEKLDSETGIPVGWSQGVIADIAKLNAKSWTKKKQPEQVHYVDLANTKNGVIETVTSYDFSEAPSRARRILNSGDTIVGTVRPGNRSFAFIGDTEQPLTGSTGFAVLSPKEECWTSFVYLATTNDDAIDEYARLADGGAYPAIKPVVVADTPYAIPTKDIAQKFWQLTGSMLKKAHQNRLENEELAKLRDTLLPRLLSGEIDLDKVLDV